MRFLLNLIWLVFGGLCLVLSYAVAGLVLLVTSIGIPLGVASFKLVPVSLLPLGKIIVDTAKPYTFR